MHGEELLLRSDEGIDFDLAFGVFGARLQKIVEDGAAGLACCSEDGVGGHGWGLVEDPGAVPNGQWRADMV